MASRKKRDGDKPGSLGAGEKAGDSINRPFAKALADELNRLEEEHPDMPEHKEVAEIPVRARLAQQADTLRSPPPPSPG